ncbi:MAG: hypothetical protein GX442_06715 [Candidatus Riflebacteria bacterium]|nr:hypothetical protein [Candidatus Riflebacteria bacterium]
MAADSWGKRLFWLPFVVFVLWYALHDPIGCFDGPGPWRRGNCRLIMRVVARAVHDANLDRPSSVTGIATPTIDRLVREGYFRRPGYDFSDPEMVTCPGGYLPDPPGAWQKFWEDIEFRLVQNLMLPIPLLSTIGASTFHESGSFTLATAPGKVWVVCSVHGPGEPFSTTYPPGLASGQADLWSALRQGRTAEVARLLAAGVPLPTTPWDQRDPLAWAAHNDHLDTLRLLLDRLPPERRTDVANRLLTETLDLEAVTVASFLVSLGAHVDHRPPGGAGTLLHEAIFQQRPGMVEFLLAAGADPATSTRDGQTPASLARSQVWREDTLERILTALGRRPGSPGK